MNTSRVRFYQDIPITCGDQLKYLLMSQVFTPCGRYGISLPMNFRIQEHTSHPTLPMKLMIEEKRTLLPVVDYFNRGITHYRFKDNIQYDFIYCLSSTKLVSVRAKPNGFEQKVWNLNHKEKTVEFESVKYYEHKIQTPELLVIHENCRKDFVMKFSGETYNVWISAEPHDLGHYLIFLIPRNPNSQERMKLLYVQLETLQYIHNPVFRYFSLQANGSAYMAPHVVGNSIWFPAGRFGFQVIGIWLTVSLELLVDMIDSEREPDVEYLQEVQRAAYQYYIKHYKTDSNILRDYPRIETEYFATRMHTIYWDKNIEPPGYSKWNKPRRIYLIGNSQDQGSLSICNASVLTVHPSGWIVQWDQDIYGVTATRHNLSNGPVKTLFEIVKKKLILQSSVDIQSIPGYDRIIFK